MNKRLDLILSHTSTLPLVFHRNVTVPHPAFVQHNLQQVLQGISFKKVTHNVTNHMAQDVAVSNVLQLGVNYGDKLIQFDHKSKGCNEATDINGKTTKED